MKHLLLLFFLVPMLAKSQEIIRWKYIYDDFDTQAADVLQTPDGGYLALGVGSLGYPDQYLRLVKLDAFGNVQWDMPYFGPGQKRINSGVVLEDGGYLLAGSLGEGSGSFSNTNESGYLMKLKANGDVVWIKTLETNDRMGLEEIKALPDGNFVVCGYKYNHTAYPHHYDGYVARINGDGEILWERNYGAFGVNELLYDVEFTNDGGLIFAGQANGGGVHRYLVKVNAMGDEEWVYTNNGVEGDGLTSVELLPCGDYMIGGFTGEFNYDDGKKMYLARVNPAGYIVWENSLHLGAISSIELADSNHLVIGGYVHTPDRAWGESYIGHVDDNGQEDWSATYDYGADAKMMTNVHPTPDGGYICSSWFDIPAGPNDAMLIIKTDGNGRINDLGFDQLPTGAIKLFPNPSNGQTQLMLPQEMIEQSGQAELVIVDVLGRVVKNIPVTDTQTSFDCSSLGTGIYSVAVVVDRSTLYAEKLVVE